MKRIALVASGDLRESANNVCWPTQADMESRLTNVLAEMGYELWRAHPVKASGHGFISSQREGMDVFKGIDPDMPLIVAEAVWQYTHHVLPGLTSHRGPILTLANWSGQWPGLVGVLNLNAGLTKAGIPYSTLWSEDFSDPFFLGKVEQWLDQGMITHDRSHVQSFDPDTCKDLTLVEDIAAEIRSDKVIMGIFDEGCMGMYNAIIPDELLMAMGIFKERLSQSALYYATTQVSDADAQKAMDWLIDKGLTFHFGSDHQSELTRQQVLDQCCMYIAAVRMADEFGCEAIGIQYQQGLKDLLPASDLVEGMLNNDDRPDVLTEDGKPIRSGQAIVHFNEVDECAGLDGILTNRVHRALGQPVETTLHDIRWGDNDRTQPGDPFVWVFEISGGAPPAHHKGGWAGSESFRQPPMYFPSGGGTLKGNAKAGTIIWSRIYVEDNRLKMDLGLGQAVELSPQECERRSQATSPQWPMMHATLQGISRDQMMGHHKSNHIQVAYANSVEEADRAMRAKAALANTLGIETFLCGIS